jgi:hypothetical protein
MKKLIVFLSVLTGSLGMVHTVHADAIKMSPKAMLGKEIALLLDNAGVLNLKGETIEATVALMINEDMQCVVIDTGTDNPDLDRYIRNKLDSKRIWTRDVKQQVIYRVHTKFEPGR